MAPGYNQLHKPKTRIVKEAFKKKDWCKHDTDDSLDYCPDHDSIALKSHKGK